MKSQGISFQTKSGHPVYIQTLHNDCTHIEDVYLLFCKIVSFFFLIFDGC